MKYRLALALMVMVISGMVVALVGAQSAPEATPTLPLFTSSVIRQDIFVRGGPGIQYVPVGRLVAGDFVTAVSRNAQGDWVMINYHRSFGWIRRDLAYWVENVDALPVISEANLTPSPIALSSASPSPSVILLPTETPTGNWVLLQADAQSGYVRAGPGRTYLRLGQLYNGDIVDPVGRTDDAQWIMIRFADGFGWIRADLVKWVGDLTILPVLSPDNLTPTFTFTPSDTPTSTLTPTDTATPTSTLTLTSTVTPSSTPTDTATATLTLTPTETSSSTPTLTETASPTATATPQPTDTPTETATATLIPSSTPTDTPSVTAAPSDTATAAPTVTDTPTQLPSETPIPGATATEAPLVVVVPTDTETPVPSETPTYTETATSTETATFTAVPSSTSTETPQPSHTPSETPISPSATFTSQPTTAIQAVPSEPIITTIAPSQMPSQTPVTETPLASETALGAITGNVTATPASAATSTTAPGGLPSEAVLGGVIVLLVLLYAALYWRGAAAADRYAGGFVVERCPVCQRGHLTVETRPERLLGIPRPRRTVRCDECRSVLRETSARRWRYAVDPIENPDLYRQYNGQELDEQTLADLVNHPVSSDHDPIPRPPAAPPDFVDDDQ